jgi:hypothetical protein
MDELIRIKKGMLHKYYKTLEEDILEHGEARETMY